EIKEEERTLNEMVRDGILMIGTRQRPELMEKELIKYLDSKSVERYKALKATAEATNQRMVI
ncbi:MAG: hypothetical protein GY866_02045, partial [Proteobacteria bacterium]|nr:hypothetical protein [Pseudomonadota bacterium]